MKLLFSSLAFVASFAFVAMQALPPRCPPGNPRPPVHLPHPTDCSLFFICSDGVAHLMPPCPPGLLFDTPSSSCRPAADAVCGEVPTTVPPPTTEPPATTEPPLTTEEPLTTPEGETTVDVPTDVPTIAPPTTGIPTAPPVIPTAPPVGP